MQKIYKFLGVQGKMGIGDTIVGLLLFLGLMIFSLALLIGAYYDWRIVNDLIQETRAHNGTCTLVGCSWTEVHQSVTTFINERCLLNGEEVNCSEVNHEKYQR